jgi:hypothetical protein
MCHVHELGGLVGERNGNFKSGRFTKQARELSQYFRKLARTAETVVALAAHRSGRKVPQVYRRRRHVQKALREAVAAKAKAEQGST